MTAPAEMGPLEILELRARLFSEIRGFFGERGFTEVDTPSLVSSPGLDVHLSAFAVHDGGGRRVGWLSTSPEYHMKRLLVAGAERIFQLTRSYRAEERGSLHEREFTMLEWYRAHAGSKEVMQDTELLAVRLSETVGSEVFAATDVPWARTTVREAFREHAGVELETLRGDDDAFFRRWVERVQPRLGQDRPVFVTDWPASMASLARLKENGMADRFEAFYRGVELCNGYGELTDPKEQRKRLERDLAERRAASKPLYPIDERFLEALERGMPESGGNALGFDRLLMVLERAESIQAVMPFPENRL